MQKNDLIIEIGTEELPPKSLRKLAEAFHSNIISRLEQATLSFDSSKWYATPKRLAVFVSQLDEQQEDQVVEKRGPAVSSAFDADGNPTKAALGWASGNGITIDEAERLSTDKGEWLLLKKVEQGKALSELLEDIINQALKALPIPKPMRWGNNTEEFVRPVHSVLVLFGNNVLPLSIKGLTASNKVQGHRFHAPEFVEIDSASNYESVLNERFVVADYETRKSFIKQGLEAKAAELNAVVDMEEDLLEEVTSLVEFPVIMTATFEEHFLEVPKEALIYTMKGDQKYFPLLDKDGKLLPKFLFVSNIQSSSPEKVVAGNERVIRPRLADAKFFYTTDLKVDFASRVNNLENIVFQKQLGTLKERVERIASLSKDIATQINANADDAQRAGLLCKNDLVSNMVLEFTSMQGTMGRYYAAASGENETVATAIGEQYLPAFSGDRLPSSNESASVAIAEKLDTLVGIFATGQVPKGDKDPFALRRATIGILRICIEKNLDLDLAWLVSIAAKLVQPKFDKDIDQKQILEFMFSRLKSMYQDSGVDSRVVQSVLLREPSKAIDFDARIGAVQDFVKHPAADSLIEANKRVANILRKSTEETSFTPSPSVNTELFEADQEKALYSAIEGVKTEVESLASNFQYGKALETLSSLKEVLDAFFDGVMVNADNADIKQNRLTLLSQLRALFLNIADVSVLN
ncbi:glycine--tRNA ligase subunit beta [Paraneptunicella aestuarii]|uniref:glycine--tRNA ligase subunit beta n=1 Tax=Paraneptunicella aestuarii TaxID=2831148 RepID=UPI001E2E4949|nr:glycine--tRNA ligase subunit beta [Paraneptunicella aestuarii]UAA38807.1 glycine--tRNA ligase subunit beta [Paraneptunicella aestuarii]